VKNVALGRPQGQIPRGMEVFHFTYIMHAYLHISCMQIYISYTYETPNRENNFHPSIKTKKISIPAMLSV